MTHLTFEAIVELAAAPDAERPSHVLGCARCRDQLATTTTLLETLVADPGGEPSPAALRRAHDLFGTRERLAGAARRFTRWLGTVAHDSALTPATAGVRGADAGTRQLLFTTERVDLDLSHPTAGAVRALRGQALPAADDGDELVALRPVTLRVSDPAEAEAAPRVTSTDEHGAFRFADVAPGRYELAVELDDGEVAVAFQI